jgi:hypothetical protein
VASIHYNTVEATFLNHQLTTLYWLSVMPVYCGHTSNNFICHKSMVAFLYRHNVLMLPSPTIFPHPIWHLGSNEALEKSNNFHVMGLHCWYTNSHKVVMVDIRCSPTKSHRRCATIYRYTSSAATTTWIQLSPQAAIYSCHCTRMSLWYILLIPYKSQDETSSSSSWNIDNRSCRDTILVYSTWSVQL